MSLKRLVISFCEGLEALSNGLQSCRDLEWHCDNLKPIPDLRRLLYLTELSIRNCQQLRWTSVRLSDRLKTLEIGLSDRLKTLEIGLFCEELESFPTLISSDQPSLEKLELFGWAILNSLPVEIKSFTAFKFLYICGFDGILALPEWLDHLLYLQSLTVDNCKKLMNFPTAEAMRSLTNLTKLEICDCPKLQKECAKGTGTEWYKIDHILIIQINGEYIQGEGYDI
jgi:hypothetical protein